MASEVILAIDGGGTYTRCVAIDRDGRILGRGEGGPSNHLLIDQGDARRALSSAMDGALTNARLAPSAVRCVAAGLAGVDYDGAGAEVGRSLIGDVETAVVAMEGDVVIAHLAALTGRPGVVALAGTGSNLLGIGPDGTRMKVGGWGPLYGNEGSAHEIARQALAAAARAYDGLAPFTSLIGAIVQRFGLRDFRDTLVAIYGAGLDVSDVAALAPLVQEVAEGGDRARARFSCGREPIWHGAQPPSSNASGSAVRIDSHRTRAPCWRRVPSPARRSSGNWTALWMACGLSHRSITQSPGRTC